MTITRKGKFLYNTDLEGELLVGIESDKLSACVKEARRRKAFGVFGAPCWGFKQDDLNFLAELPDLKSIWFWDVTLKDVEGVYELKQLKEFGIHPKRPGIDFSRLATLEQLVWEYNKKDTGLEALKRLKLFHIWHYNPKKKSFDGVVVPKSVTEMQINWANPRSLEGLPIMPKLKRLEIARCRNLETLAALPQIAPRLDFLFVEACGRVSDGKTVVKKLPKLNFAFVHDTILVKDKKLVFEKIRRI
ncbi:MAG: hypothetical protein ACYSW3_24835 [Planctomycetota bacterium]|jgi:hypothetical protein